MAKAYTKLKQIKIKISEDVLAALKAGSITPDKKNLLKLGMEWVKISEKLEEDYGTGFERMAEEPEEESEPEGTMSALEKLATPGEE